MNTRDDAFTPRLLFVRTDRLGETLLNLPAVDALRKARPEARLLMMVHPNLLSLLNGHPDLDEVMAEPRDGGAWWWRAWCLSRLWRSWRIDTVIISNPKKEYHLAAWLAGIPVRVGYNRKWGWLLTHRIPADPAVRDVASPRQEQARLQKTVGGRHEVEYNLRLLDALGIPRPSHPSLQLPVTAQEDQRLIQLFTQLGVSSQEQLVAVHPWTSNPRKQWPVERFGELVRYLAAQPGVTPVLIGGSEERATVQEIVGRDAAGVLDMVGRLSLKELAACLRRVRVLVSNDSGPMHVAAAVGTPVIALFGTGEVGSHPRRWGPWGSGHTVIHKPLEEITLDEVTGALSQYLG